MTAIEERTTGAHTIGIRRPRSDAIAKLTGVAAYTADVPVPGLLHGRLVPSPHAHALIKSIDASAALDVPGVHAVLTYEDLPIVGGTGRMAEPLARGEALFAGQPVALVVAIDEASAEDGVEAVIVDYEPVEAVVDLEDAARLDAPRARFADRIDEAHDMMHGDIVEDDRRDGDAVSPNFVNGANLVEGDVEAAFARCAAVVSGRFRSSWVHQAYLEPQVATAWPEPGGGIAIRTSTQAIFVVRCDIAVLLGLTLAQVRVEAGTSGGAFGGKLRLIDPLVASAAWALRRPVQVAFTRSEDFAAANPAPATLIDVEIGALADGSLAALRARMLVDTGASSEVPLAQLAAPRIAGPYRIGAWAVETQGIRTNTPGAGPYRAPLATPTTFAIESVLDELAAKLEIDPVELRLRNAAQAGDRRLDGSVWPALGTLEVLEAAGDHPLWRRRSELPDGEGVGFAFGLFPGGKQGAAAVCRMDADGGLTVLTGYVDITGTETTVAAIAGEAFGVPFDRVRVVSSGTATAPHSGGSAGSMVTYCLGSAVLTAAKEAREKLFRVAAQRLECDASNLELVDGEVRPVGSHSRGVTLEQIGELVNGFSPYPPIEGHGSGIPEELSPSAAAALVHVRVDRETGDVELLDYVAVQDVGRALNPDLCEGQMRGGAVQSIGFALYEELGYDEDGQLLSGSFLHYALPKAEAMPPIETILVEVPSPLGPFGAKGIGESGIVAGAGAVGNAIAAATGVRFRCLPMTAERLWRGLERSMR